MTQNEIQNLKSELKLYVMRYDEMNASKLATLFIDEKDTELSHRSVRRYISLIKQAEKDLDEDLSDHVDPVDPVDTVQDDIVPDDISNKVEPCDRPSDTFEEEDPADITIEENPDHTFKLKFLNTTYEFSRRLVDKVICAYSRKGLNLTSGAVQSALGLSAYEITCIISKLGINKESDPFSNYSYEAVEPSQLYAELEENVADLMDKVAEDDTTVTSKLTKMYKKSLVTSQQNDLKFRAVIEEMKDVLPKITIGNPWDKTNPEYVHGHLIIPDMHIGVDQLNYNVFIVEEQLKNLLTYVDGIEHLHVHFLGDILHSVSGLNHKDSWKHMDPEMHGANAIIKPYKILLNFLSNLENLHSVNIVGGNHDRLQASWSDEHTAEGAKLLAFMLDGSLTDTPVKFDANRVIDDSDPGLTMILLHGDKKVDNLPARDIAWNFGNKDKFNYIATGHLHSRKTDPKDDGLKFRKERLPAFCPQDNYGSTVANPSLPGVKLIVSDAHEKLPIVIDIPLDYADV